MTTRTDQLLEEVTRAGRRGTTWAEAGKRLGLSQGQVTAPLSKLEADGLVRRLREPRGGSLPYVVIAEIHGRGVAPSRAGHRGRVEHLIQRLETVADDWSAEADQAHAMADKVEPGSQAASRLNAMGNIRRSHAVTLRAVIRSAGL